MGIVQSHPIHRSIFSEKNRKINENQFITISNYSYTHQADPQYGSNFKVLLHRESQFELEKYELIFNTYEEYRAYREIYEWRRRFQYFVQAKDIQEKADNKMCGGFHEATLFVQRIPIRASEITDVSIEEGLYLLYSCLLGFRKIYESISYFDLSLDMICINKQAHIKIWLNSNLSKVYPQYHSLDRNLTEGFLIQKILTLCEPLIDFTPIKQKFSEFIQSCEFNYQKHSKKQRENRPCLYLNSGQVCALPNKKQEQTSLRFITFDESIEYLQGYLSKHNLVVARQMKSVKDLFRIQSKIFHDSKVQTKKSTVHKPEFKDQDSQVVPFLLLNESKSNHKNEQNKKNTKRTNQKLGSDRSNKIKPEVTFSYKSRDGIKNIWQLKNSKVTIQKDPFSYRPINTARHTIKNTQISSPFYSPDHLNQNKFLNLHYRDRIKKVNFPNISFNQRLNHCEIKNNQTKNLIKDPDQELGLINKNEKKRKMKKESNQKRDFSSQRENKQNCKENVTDMKEKLLEIKEKILQIKQKMKCKFKKSLEYQQSQTEISQEQNRRKRKAYYASEKEEFIDEDIAVDLETFQKFSKDGSNSAL